MYSMSFRPCWLSIPSSSRPLRDCDGVPRPREPQECMICFCSRISLPNSNQKYGTITILWLPRNQSNPLIHIQKRNMWSKQNDKNHTKPLWSKNVTKTCGVFQATQGQARRLSQAMQLGTLRVGPALVVQQPHGLGHALHGLQGTSQAQHCFPGG